MDNSNASSYRAALAELLTTFRALSPDAAECLAQLEQHFGTRAAYLAAYALHVLKIQADEHRRVPTIMTLKSFTFYEEMQQHPEAVALYYQATTHLFPDLLDSEL